MADHLHFLFLLLLSISFSTAEISFHANRTIVVCGTSGTFNPSSTYASNLAAASTSVTTNASTPGSNLFATAAVAGEVYALGLCRGDISASACAACLSGGFAGAQTSCSYSKDATVYYETCLLRYSDRDFLSGGGNAPVEHEAGGDVPVGGSPVGVPGDLVGPFVRLVVALMNATADYAAFNATSRFAVSKLEGFQYPVYEMAQCTPDMSPAACRGCLAGEIGRVVEWFGDGTQGGRVVGVRCGVRFETYAFYGVTPMMVLTPAEAVSPAPANSGKTTRIEIVLAVAIPVIAIALALILVILVCLCRQSNSSETMLYDTSGSQDISNVKQLLISLDELRVATDDFADYNKLGEGGFGTVHKGVLRDGQLVAVKRLSQSSGQGIEELRNELVLLARLQHKNLVRLLGACLEDQEKMLVYEYVPNRSLDTILFDPEKRGLLNWTKRYNVISGIASGLQYLHEESQLTIIHRDLKLSNILLDEDMNPKISDFGMARLFSGEQTHNATSRVVGTFGYMAPEYAMRGLYSVKSDVFSFGVLVLEILTGRRNNDSFGLDTSDDLPTTAWEHWNSSTVQEILDPSMADSCCVNQALRCAHIGMLCVQENPTARPTMSLVNVMLGTETVSLGIPSMPAFVARRVDEDASNSINETSASHFEAR